VAQQNDIEKTLNDLARFFRQFQMYPRAEFIESLKAKLAEEGLQAAAPELTGVNLWGGAGSYSDLIIYREDVPFLLEELEDEANKEYSQLLLSLASALKQAGLSSYWLDTRYDIMKTTESHSCKHIVDALDDLASLLRQIQLPYRARALEKVRSRLVREGVQAVAVELTGALLWGGSGSYFDLVISEVDLPFLDEEFARQANSEYKRLLLRLAVAIKSAGLSSKWLDSAYKSLTALSLSD
jgi:hypothetical protein